MVHYFFDLLPTEASTLRTGVAAAVALVGAAVWVVGGRFNRPLVTLLGVLLGACVGMQMPRWFGWTISGAGPAVGMAVVLGVAGLVLSPLYAGLLLGLTLSAWAAFVTWIVAGGALPFYWPDWSNYTLVGFAVEWWRNLPPDVAKYLPYTTAASLVSGVAMAIIASRLTTALAWSAAGATMLAGGSLAAVNFTRPQWFEGRAPALWLQIAVMVVLVAAGTALQWKLTGGAGPKRSKADTGDRPQMEESPE